MKATVIIAGLFAGIASAGAVLQTRDFHAKNTEGEFNCWKKCFIKATKLTECGDADYSCECVQPTFLTYMKGCEGECGCEMHEYIKRFCPRDGKIQSFGKGRWD